MGYNYRNLFRFSFLSLKGKTKLILVAAVKWHHPEICERTYQQLFPFCFFEYRDGQNYSSIVCILIILAGPQVLHSGEYHPIQLLKGPPLLWRTIPWTFTPRALPRLIFIWDRKKNTIVRERKTKLTTDMKGFLARNPEKSPLTNWRPLLQTSFQASSPNLGKTEGT